ncbi:MAG: malate dehydrogenase [Candidatus Omnitrophica bacterium]|nr:malate dehydrogenase [Candidatus Omnitrophota bacterium]MBU1933347.1 malate dehydrogenase [Candidatus Omnitrophota bacterium]
MKVAIIGAGNVGAMVASRVVDSGLADVALIDIAPGLAKGKALDISDSRPITGSSSKIEGSEDLKDMRGAGIVVVTAGLARKPGMSRDDLIRKNSEIIKDVSLNIKKHASLAIVIIVTNPLDAMSYLTMKTAAFKPERVIGMAGVLDSARFINMVSSGSARMQSDRIFMMGSHGDTMVAINRSVDLDDKTFKEASEKARNRGAEIVGHLKTGSAYFAPSAAVFSMLRAILKDENRTVCCSAYLDGEYGEKDVYIGVPVTLGSSGVIKIIEIELTQQEKKAFKKSVRQIRDTIAKL